MLHNMDKLRVYYAKWKKLDTISHIFFVAKTIELLKQT